MSVSLAKIISTILSLASKPAFDVLKRQEKVIKLRQELNLGAELPEPNFESVFAHAMIEYSVDVASAGVEFFKHRDVQRALRKAFTADDIHSFLSEAEELVKWNRIGDVLRDSSLTPKAEFEKFYPILCKWADLSRTPGEARTAQQLNRIERRLETITTTNSPTLTQAWTLETDLRSWFQALGHSFERSEPRTEGRFVWILNVRSHRGYVRICVQGVRGEIQAADVEAAGEYAVSHRLKEAWVVTDRRISQAAVLAAKEKGSVFCYTLDGLIDQDANWDAYLDWLEAEVLRRRIPELYVPLACSKDERAEQHDRARASSRYAEDEGWVEGYLDRWLSDPAKEHISILGEFGTGKTWVALHFAWLLLRRYREAQRNGTPRPRVPILISLREYAKAVSVESLFSDFFFRKHELRLPSYLAFEQLNRMGKLVLVFDGFDEMAARVDRQRMIDNFWELAKSVVPGSKVLLTCRTEHFPEARDGRQLLNAELLASTAKLTGEPPQFEVLELEKLTESQIRTTLEKRGASPESVARLLSSEELRDLATRPVMLDLLIEALPDIEANRPIDMARVYLYAIQRKVERDIRDERTFTSTADKFYFLAELCWEMWVSDQLSINYRQFPDRIRRLFGNLVTEQKELDHWHYDMMGQTLLVRNADGDYTPAHRSFMEFFVAYKIAAELGLLDEEFIEPIRKNAQIDPTEAVADYTWATYFRNRSSTGKAVHQQAPLGKFVQENQEKIMANLGIKPITEPVKQLICKMLNKEITKDTLIDLIYKTRDNPDRESCLGGNAATILIGMFPDSLRGVDISKCNLNHANLYGADLSFSKLRECNIPNANLTFSVAIGADFSMSNMLDTTIGSYTARLREQFPMNTELIFYHPELRGLFDSTDLSPLAENELAGAHFVCLVDGNRIWSFPNQSTYANVQSTSLESASGIVGVMVRSGKNSNEMPVVYFIDIATGATSLATEQHPVYRWRNANLDGVSNLVEIERRLLRDLGAINLPDV